MASERIPTKLTSGREATDDLWEAIHSQRAIRYWTSAPVPRALLETVVAAAAKAPSGSNTQPWVFVVVDDRDKLAAIAAALREVSSNIEGLRGMLDNADDIEDKTTRLMLQGARAFFGELERAPALIIPCLYGLSSPTNDPTSLLAGSSIYMAVQNLMLAARGVGLGTVMTTAHEMVDKPLRELLAIPQDAHPVALIPIGFPDANFGPTKRKPIEDVIRFNSWG
jgi:nitroreductase